MLKRTRNWELYKRAHNCYNKEKRKAKWPLRGTTVRQLRMYLTGPLTKIMASQLANRVGVY